MMCACVSYHGRAVCVQVARKEYRGQRSVDAIVEFVRTQLNPPVEVIRGTHELAQKVRQSDWSIKNVTTLKCYMLC